MNATTPRRTFACATAAVFTIACWSGAALADTIFVSNEKDNTVTVLDAKTLDIIKTIPTGLRPRGIVITPDFREVLVCVGDDNRLDVIDTEKLEVTRTLPSGPDPELLDVDPAGKRIYVANEDDSIVTILEREDGKMLAEVPVGIEPEGMAVSPDNTITVATSEATSMAHVIDNKTFEVLANILVDTRPREARFVPGGGKHFWVSSEIGGTVSVIDTATLEPVKKFGFEIPGVDPDLIQPVGIRFKLDGSKAFVALSHANRVAVVDTKTFEVDRYIIVGQRPWHMAMAPDGKYLYVANGLTNDMTVVNVDTYKPEKSVPVGRLPWGVAIKPSNADDAAE